MADKAYMFEWNASYSVGVASIDGQHQKLFAIARELHAAMVAGQGKSAVGRIVERLVSYTLVHFAHEERLMRLYDFPGLAAHIAEHDGLTRRVTRFQEDLNAGGAAITVQLLQFLRDWLRNHIQVSDRKYASHIKDQAA